MKNRALFILTLLLVPFGAARAEDLVSGISQDLIEITSNFTGTEIVVFGAIEAMDPDVSSTRDIVVVVRGPESEMAVRRKARVAGLWVNRDRITLWGMPAYYFMASTRPLDRLASEQTLQRYQIGLSNVVPTRESTRNWAKGEPFRYAAIRQSTRDKLYIDKTGGVEFLSNSLFRVRVPVPAAAPRGQYTAEVYLFRDGNVISAQSTPLFVDQTGLERRLYKFAHDQPFAYGLLAVLVAVLLGWISAVVFRQR